MLIYTGLTEMSKSVKLSDLIDGMEFQSEEMSSYLNKETGEVVSVTDDEICTADNPLEEDSLDLDEEQIEIARDILDDVSGKKYIPLPSKYDIHEYNIMEKFCLSIADNRISDTLHKVIKGKGAFRRFKDSIQILDVEDEWFRYRDESIKRIAIDWCQENDIKYIDS